MKIRSKVILALGGTAIVLLVILYTVSIFIVERSLLRLEEENVRFQLNQVVTEFKMEAVHLDAVNLDWASWGATYAFVDSSDPNLYITENISDNVLKYLRLNIFAVFNTDMELFYYYFLAPNQAKPSWSESELRDFLTNATLRPDLKKGREPRLGFMLMNSTPVLTADRYVLRSDSSGPPKGILFVGRIFDAELIALFESKYDIKIKLYPVDQSEFSDGEIKILKRTKNHIYASLLLDDISGFPALSLEIQQPRTIFQTGWSALKNYALLIALVTLTLAGLMIFFMEKIVLKKLWLVFSNINLIIETKDFGSRLKVVSHDEFGTLADNINHLLASLSAYEADKTDQQLESLAGRVLSGSLIFVHNSLVYQNEEQTRINGPIRLGLSFNNYLILYIHPSDRHLLSELFLRAEVKQDTSVQSITIRCFKFLSEYQGEPSQKWVQATSYKFKFQNQDACFLNMVDISKTKSLEQILFSREKMTSLGRVAAGIAHEIRNPLMGIGLTIDNLKDYFDGREEMIHLEDMLEQAREATQNISLVVERVLDFARSSELNLVKSNPKVSIETAIKLSKVVAQKHDVAIKSCLPDNLPLIMADVRMLVEVFVNLISNAVQAMAGQSQEKIIKITITEANRALEIRIIDSGPGVLGKDVNNLFEPFFTTKEDGSGLGLNICRRVITDHGGTIELDFSSLSGATFLITLPVANEAES